MTRAQWNAVYQFVHIYRHREVCKNVDKAFGVHVPSALNDGSVGLVLQSVCHWLYEAHEVLYAFCDGKTCRLLRLLKNARTVQTDFRNRSVGYRSEDRFLYGSGTNEQVQQLLSDALDLFTGTGGGRDRSDRRSAALILRFREGRRLCRCRLDGDGAVQGAQDCDTRLKQNP